MTSVRRPPAVRWSRARTGAARWRGSWFIRAPITISTARIFRFTRSAEPPMRPCRKTVTSAPTRKPAPIRKSASRSGWRGRFKPRPALCGERSKPKASGEGRGNAPDAIMGLSGQQIASPATTRPERFVILTSAVPCPSPGLHRTMLRIAEAIRPLPAKKRGEGKRSGAPYVIHDLKQTSLADRLCNALRRRRLRLACNWFRRTGCHRPIRVRGGADAPVRKFQVEPRTRADAGCGVDGEAVLIAHQCEAAGQHAAIRQRRQQLSAVGDPRLEALQGHGQRAPRALGQALRAFAVARDGLVLR